MKRSWKFWCIPFLGISLMLGACSSQQGMEENKVEAETGQDFHDENLNKKGTGHQHGETVIPSVDRTSNTEQTTNGIGSNVYSLIGSSGLHDGGISAHLESRLSGEGIPGVKVFVIDDTIILARAQQEVTSTRYDEIQNKVLKNTAGLSGKGSLDGVDPEKLNNDDNLERAKEVMNKAFNGNVQILTITNPEALPLIEGIKTNIKSATPTYNKLSSDIITLVKMANEK
jgi:hypothetical protein